MVTIGIQLNFDKQNYTGLAKLFNEGGYEALGLNEQEILDNPNKYKYTNLDFAKSFLPTRYLDKWEVNTWDKRNELDFEGLPKKLLNSTAFVTRAKPGQEHLFAIWIPVSSSSPLYDYLLAHELGHIMFGHMFIRFDSENLLVQEVKNNEKEIGRIIQEVVEEFKNSIQDASELDKLNLTPEDIKEIVYRLPDAIGNLLMDFEINSKLFTHQEFVQLTALSQLEKVFQSHVKSENEGEESTEGMKEKIENVGHTLFGAHPSQLGMPDRLSYHDYVILFLNDFKKYVKAVIQLLSGNPKGLKKSVKELSEDTGNFGEGSDCGGKERGSGSGTKTCVIQGNNLINLKKYIKVVQECQGYYKDPLFNYNRGRSKDVLIPRVRRNLTKGTSESVLTSLVDVSGSMDEKKVMRLCESINSTSARKKVTAFWNTELVQEVVNDIPESINMGGGTDLAPGIRWIVENHPNTVQLFIMSDFEDDLEAIQKELLQLRSLRSLVFVIVDDPKARMESRIKQTIVPKLTWASSTIVQVI